jgi:hypothetical protein
MRGAIQKSATIRQVRLPSPGRLVLVPFGINSHSVPAVRTLLAPRSMSRPNGEYQVVIVRMRVL